MQSSANGLSPLLLLFRPIFWRQISVLMDEGGRGHCNVYDKGHILAMPNRVDKGMLRPIQGGSKYQSCISDQCMMATYIAGLIQVDDHRPCIRSHLGCACRCDKGYTPLMVACHRGRLECARALLRAGADPNWQNGRGDFTLFWAIDGGVDMIKLLHRYDADLDVCNAKDWTPLSYARAKGKYGATEEKGIYPEVYCPREQLVKYIYNIGSLGPIAATWSRFALSSFAASA